MEKEKVNKSHKSSGKHKHKSKKRKKERRRSSDSDGSVKMEWVEAAPKEVEKKRESWMTQEDEFVQTLTRDQMRESSRERKKREPQEAVLHVRELNPHWSSGGTGLPEEAKSVSQPRLPSLSVGDGGYAFLTKARIRIREQAERDGRSMEDVAVERWGSLSALDALITEAEERMHSHSRQRTEDGRSPNRSIQFQKPSDRGRHDKCNVSSTRREKGRSHNKTSRTSERRTYEDDAREKGRHQDKIGRTSERRTHEDDERRKRESERRIYDDSHVSARDETRSRLPAWKKPTSGEGTSSRAILGASPPKSPREHTGTPFSEDPAEDSVNRLAAKRMKAELAGESVLVARLSEEEEACRVSRVGTSSKDSLNRLAAMRMKAELSGDSVLASRLLEEEKAYQTSGGSGRERVILTKMDSSGQQRPVLSSREDAGFERRTDRQKKRPNKYFDDCSKYSLKQMFEREKLTTSEDNLEMFLEVSAECDDSREETETSGISKRATQKMLHAGQEEKDIQKAIQQHQKLSSALERCEYCLDQPNMKQHLIVDIQEQVFVCMPNFQSLVSGHCLVIPKRHVPSLLHLDEDEWKGVQEAVGSVRCMFRSQGKSVLCLETSFLFSRCPHAVAECIPLPREQGDEAPLYFKKALLESEEEWAHNVKLVDLSPKGLRRSIPRGLPYFCVMFDPSGGFAHVIENEKAFPRNFGKEVVGGMLDIDYNHLYKNRREDPLKKSKEALDFTHMWEESKQGGLDTWD